MLPGGLDPMYRMALATSHQPYLRVDVLDGAGNTLATNITYLSGAVQATLNSNITRRCTIQVHEDMYPFDETDLLAPYGNQLQVVRGIEYATGHRNAWTVFVGRIQEAQLTSDGVATIHASDYSTDVVENKFLVPQNSAVGVPVGTQVRELIQNGYPPATFATFDVDDIPVPQLTWQLERGQALNELATSVGAYWYALADGSFTLRRYPWTVPTSPVVTYQEGDDGTITSYQVTRSRDDVYNSLTVTGETLTGSTPVYATAQDNTPGSLTEYGGNFGRRHQLFRLQTPGSQAAAFSAAQENLRRLVSPIQTWNWAMTVDAALELGDTVRIDAAGQSGVVQIVDGFTIPLHVDGMMQVSGRSQVIGPLEGVS